MYHPAVKTNLPATLRRWQGPRTAAQAAADLGVNRRTYEDWLQGRRRPRGLALRAVTEIVNRKS